MGLGLARQLGMHNFARSLVASLCMLSLVPGDVRVLAQSQQPPSPEQPAKQEAVRLPAEQLDSLVAPIALYPDPLLSQTLVACTYPLEIVQLQQWLAKHKNLKDKALADEVKKQDWDPSIQAMAALPDVVKRLSENIKWTTDLGNAFLAQQSDVMDAVQRMRKKAQETGNLKSSEQQKVETKVIENKQVIVVQQANPEVIYVPSYNPTVVYGPPVYAYPPIYYPPPGYYAAGMAISFGVGMAMGAAWGGGWGWNAGWGGNNNVYINNNNNFVRNTNNRQNIYNNRQNVSNRANSTWQHNPQHRGGAPYGDRNTARQYGGTARGDTLSQRQQTARTNAQQPRASRGAGTGSQQQAAMRERGGNAQQSSGANRNSAAGSAGDRSGGGDRVGNRSVQNSSGSRSASAFGGAGGSSGSSARSSSSRGASSMGARGGGRGGGRRR
jgi:Protein of unknown function (DUF3300)